MSKTGSPVRLLALVASAAIAIGAIAAVLLFVIVRPDDFRADIEAAVSRATGRVATLGPLHLHLGLAPSLEADGMTLANIPGGSQPQMLTAKTLRANLALLPLITGEIEIDSLTLIDPVVLLETVDGTPNWQFTASRAHAGAANASPGGSGTGRTLAIRAIHIENGEVSWPGLTANRLQRLTLDATAAGANAPVDATGNVTIATVPFQLTFSGGSLDRLTGPVTPMAGPWPFSLKLQAAGGVATIAGGIRHPAAWQGYDITLTGTAPDLAPFAPLLPPAWRVPIKDLSVNAHVTDGATGQVRFSRVSVHAGEADLGSFVPGLAIAHASFTALGPGQDAQLDVDGTYNGAPLKLAGNGTQPDVPPSAPAPVTLDLQAAGASLSVRGILPADLDGTGLDLQVSARIPDLAALQPFVSAALPPLRDVSADLHLGDGPSRRAVAVRQLSITSSAGDLGGDVVVDWSQSLSLKGVLASRALSFDAFSAAPNTVRATTPAGSAAMPGGQPVPARRWPVLLNHEADLGLTIKSMVISGALYRDVATHLLLHEGRLRLDPVRFSAGGGVVTGNLTIDATQDPPPVTAFLRAPSLPASAVAALSGHPGAATGTLQLATHLSAYGLSAPEIGASLSGHVGVTMVEGDVSDDWLRGLLGEVLNTANIPAGPPGGQDHVRCFAALADFDHGRATLRNAALDASKFALTGTGTFSLADGTLDLSLRPTLRLGPTNAAMAMRVTGTFAAPQAALDPAASGRVGIVIGGSDTDPCPEALAAAREGQAGPQPNALGSSADGTGKKPLDLLKGLFH